MLGKCLRKECVGMREYIRMNSVYGRKSVLRKSACVLGKCVFEYEIV